MIISQAMISDDHVLLFLISGELSKPCFALVWIEVYCGFLGLHRSLVSDEIPE